MSDHHVRFTRHAVTGETRATCTCGDSFCSDRDTAVEWGKYHNRHGDPPEQTLVGPARFESGLE